MYQGAIFFRNLKSSCSPTHIPYEICCWAGSGLRLKGRGSVVSTGVLAAVMHRLGLFRSEPRPQESRAARKNSNGGGVRHGPPMDRHSRSGDRGGRCAHACARLEEALMASCGRHALSGRHHFFGPRAHAVGRLARNSCEPASPFPLAAGPLTATAASPARPSAHAQLT